MNSACMLIMLLLYGDQGNREASECALVIDHDSLSVKVPSYT